MIRSMQEMHTFSFSFFFFCSVGNSTCKICVCMHLLYVWPLPIWYYDQLWSGSPVTWLECWHFTFLQPADMFKSYITYQHFYNMCHYLFMSWLGSGGDVVVVLQLGKMAGKPKTTVQDKHLTSVCMKQLETWSFPHPNQVAFFAQT